MTNKIKETNNIIRERMQIDATAEAAKNMRLLAGMIPKFRIIESLLDIEIKDWESLYSLAYIGESARTLMERISDEVQILALLLQQMDLVYGDKDDQLLAAYQETYLDLQ